MFIPGIPISRNILQNIKIETANDAFLSDAIRLVKSGWPEKSATETITRVLEVKIRTYMCRQFAVNE